MHDFTTIIAVETDFVGNVSVISASTLINYLSLDNSSLTNLTTHTHQASRKSGNNL